MGWKTLSGRTKTALVTAGVAVVVIVGGATAASGATGGQHAVVAAATPSTSRVVSTPAPVATHVPKVVETTDVETAAIPFDATTVNDPTRASGTSAVTTVGVDGVLTTTFDVTTTDGVETSRVQVSQVVTTPPIAQVTSVGTYVAPAPAPAPSHSTTAVPPAAPAPAPATPTITPGAFCADAAVGTIAQSSAGVSYKCGGHGADANGHYHWNTIP